MTNSKSTKRALLSSAFAIMLCAAMLIGTTFAWFTDTASTAVNKIQAGKLNVALEMQDSTGKWVSAEGKTLNFIKAEGHEAEEILWEPGCTYKLPELRIVNKGNLALKYNLIISGAAGDVMLLDALEFNAALNGGEYIPFENGKTIVTDRPLYPGEVDGSSDILAISASMKKDADNKYQDKTLTGISVTVVATQFTYEHDSNDNQYDADAEYPEVKTVTDAAAIADAVAELATVGNKNVAVTVAKDMDNIAGIKTAKGNSLTMNMNGKTVGVSTGTGSPNTTTNGMQLLQGSTVALKNGVYKATAGQDATTNIGILIQNYSNLTIENCTLDMRDANDTAGNSAGTSYVLSSNCGKVVIKGNTNIFARANKNGTMEYALDVMHWEKTSYEEEGTSITFDETMTGTVDGKIEVYCYRGGKVVKPVDDNGAVLTIMGGTFKNSGLSLEEFKTFVPAGYTVTVNTDGSYTVTK